MEGVLNEIFKPTKVMLAATIIILLLDNFLIFCDRFKLSNILWVLTRLWYLIFSWASIYIEQKHGSENIKKYDPIRSTYIPEHPKIVHHWSLRMQTPSPKDLVLFSIIYITKLVLRINRQRYNKSQVPFMIIVNNKFLLKSTLS